MANTTTITLPGTWVEYWKGREYGRPGVDDEFRELDEMITAGYRRTGRGACSKITVNAKQLASLEFIADVMIMVTQDDEPGPDRARERRSAKAGYERIVDAWKRLDTPAPPAEPEPVTVTHSIAHKRLITDDGGVDHAGVRAAFTDFPLVTSGVQAVELLVASNAPALASMTRANLAAEVESWARLHEIPDGSWKAQQPGRILADIVITEMYRILAAEATERAAAYWRLISRRNSGARIRESQIQIRYDEYADACKQARICLVMDCETFSPHHTACAEHCNTCEDGGGDTDHEGETLAYILANPPA